MHDLRLAFRLIVRRPGFSAAAIVALAIGLAVNTVAFSAVNAFLFKERAGWNVDGAGRVHVAGVQNSEEAGVSPPEFERLAAATDGALVSAVQGRVGLAWKHSDAGQTDVSAAHETDAKRLEGSRRGGTSEAIWALLVSARYFEMLNARPLTGRLFGRGDDPTRPGVVVSEQFWRERLERAAIGSTHLTLNRADFPVIGVLPDSYEDPGGLYAPQVWLPFEARRALRLPAHLETERAQWLAMFGVLAPGASIAEVNARLQLGAAAIAREWPQTHGNRTARFAFFKERVPELQAIARASAAGMSIVGLVLLLACFNVATLLLARGVERQREMGIRRAVGATRGRILRQQITESLVLASLAGIVAVVLTVWSQDLVAVFAIPIATPQRLNVSPDVTVIAFIAAMVVVAGLLPAIAPALGASRLDLVRALAAHGYTGSGRPSPARRGLVLLQVAGSTAFLIVAALFVQSFAWTGQTDPGFETERAVVVAMEPGSQGYDRERARLTLDRVADRLRGLEGVVAVAQADRIPFSIGFRRLTEVGDAAKPCPPEGCAKAETFAVGDEFFHTMNIGIARGRVLDGSAADTAAVVVNETFANRWFPSVDAVGQQLRLGAQGERRVIIGVTRNTLLHAFGERPAPAIYVPLTATDYEKSVTIVARTSGDPAVLVRRVADAIHEVDPNVAPLSLTTMRTRLELPRWPMRAASTFFGVCGVLALVLATIGLAAMIAHAVGQRTREFGVRLAVGATSGQLFREVIGSSLRVVAPGLVIGAIGAMLFARILRAVLVGVDVGNPATYVAVVLLQATIALLACVAPARRAARVDPVVALRGD
jgi:putative ABC transport system permease protein